MMELGMAQDNWGNKVHMAHTGKEVHMGHMGHKARKGYRGRKFHKDSKDCMGYMDMVHTHCMGKDHSMEKGQLEERVESMEDRAGCIWQDRGDCRWGYKRDRGENNFWTRVKNQKTLLMNNPR